MKHRTRIALVVVSIVAASGLAVGFYFTRRPEVTTRSEAARRELAEAEADIGRFYNADARAHLAKALELDPEFPLALVLMAEFESGRGQRERAKGYVERAAASLDRVTPIERYRILVMQAALEGNEEQIDKLMAEAWKEFPRDRWVLERMAGKTFRDGKAEESMALYRKLLDVYPDSATAYNLLGYTSARQGKFAEAEEYFAKYAFIAGEQANPHDSVGELSSTPAATTTPRRRSGRRSRSAPTSRRAS